MKIDTFIKKGYSHDICEDAFAVDSVSGKVVIGDGCSSSPDTHLGSTLLTQAMLAKPDTKPIDIFMKDTYNLLKVPFPQLKVDNFDSTLLSLRLAHDAYIDVHVYGDGFIFMKTISDQLYIFEVDYSNNMPFYPSYYLTDDRVFSYKEIAERQFAVRRVEAFRNYEVLYDSPQIYDLQEPYFMRNSNIDFIGIATDGLSSFQRNKYESIPAINIIKKICDFKSFNGDFLKRRMNKIMKEFSKENIDHYDDVTIAVMKIED